MIQGEALTLLMLVMFLAGFVLCATFVWKVLLWAIAHFQHCPRCREQLVTGIQNSAHRNCPEIGDCGGHFSALSNHKPPQEACR